MWLLFIITIFEGTYGVSANGPYPSMAKCFKVREALLKTYEQPKINYEAVCVRTDQVK